MSLFPQLDAEQEAAATILAAYDPRQLDSAAKVRTAREACRILTQISRVREELIYPACVGRTPTERLNAFVIEDDLIRVLVAEIEASDPSNILYDGLMAALTHAVRRRWSTEEAPGGLWAGLAPVLEARELDLQIGERLRELDLASRAGDWEPLLPQGLETLRTSVPPGATRWTDL